MAKKAQRKRGIRADRKKLEHALFTAGFKTQAALAEQIALNENLDSAPKDMVNRAFREIAVSPSSIERIAAALNVEAYTLYLSSDREEADEARTENTPSLQHNQLLKALGILGSILVVVALSYLWYIKVDPQHSRLPNTPIHSNTWKKQYELVTSRGIKPSLAMYSHHKHKHILSTLNSTLQSQFNIVPNTFSNTTYNFVAAREIERKQVDFTFILNSRSYGRHTLLEGYLANKKQQLLISQAVYLTNELNSGVDDTSKIIANNITQLMTFDTLPTFDHIIKSTAAKFYVEGLSLLEKSYDLEFIKTAQSRFLNALQIAPNFSLAHAGLCQAYIYESWSSDERYLLEQASKHCNTAKTQTPTDEFVIASYGLMLRRTGKTEEAIELLSSFTPKNASIYYQLAYAQLEGFQKNSEHASTLAIAKQSIKKAIALDEKNWKYHFFLGLIEWTDGNRQLAISATKHAESLNSNDIVLTNLGTLHYCTGHVEKAKGYYYAILRSNPDSYLPVEQLSMLYYFSGHYEQALTLREKAITLAGDAGIHQMWGALADMFASNRQPQKAIEAYQQAIAVLDRDFARGNQSESDQVYRLYYTTRIELLTPSRQVDRRGKLNVIEQLSKNDRLDLAAIVRLGLLYHFFAPDNAQDNIFLKRAIDKCPIYKKLPQIEVIDSSTASNHR